MSNHKIRDLVTYFAAVVEAISYAKHTDASVGLGAIISNLKYIKEIFSDSTFSVYHK